MQIHHYKRAAAISLILAAMLWGYPVQAARDMVELPGAPFTVSVHPWLEVQVLPVTHQAGYKLATVLPADITDLTLLALTWPNSNLECFIAVGTQMQQLSRTATVPASRLALYIGENEPLLINGSASELTGITRLAVWPTSRSASADLVVLYSTVSTMQDAVVSGFVVSPAGGIRQLEMGRALTLYGWFEVRDINNDDLYELITSRNLDGMWGGFFYHSVRTYDMGSAAYLPQPESCKEYFEQELAWLQWVIATRMLIKAAPENFLNQTGIGPAYIAEYQGIRYGFDSIIELPSTYTAGGDITQFNSDRRECFRLILKYHDELEAWIKGGDHPDTWKLIQ